MDCLFCSLIQKEKSAYVIYEDDAVFAFLDIFPRAIGHTIVVPKRHMETVLEMKPEEMQPFWTGVNNTLQILKDYVYSQGLAPYDGEVIRSGFTIGINHGKVSGQEIEHLHIHLMPRFEGDGGGSIQSVIKNSGTQDVKEVYERIKLLNT